MGVFWPNPSRCLPLVGSARVNGHHAAAPPWESRPTPDAPAPSYLHPFPPFACSPLPSRATGPRIHRNKPHPRPPNPARPFHSPLGKVLPFRLKITRASFIFQRPLGFEASVSCTTTTTSIRPRRGTPGRYRPSDRGHGAPNVHRLPNPPSGLVAPSSPMAK